MTEEKLAIEALSTETRPTETALDTALDRYFSNEVDTSDPKLRKRQRESAAKLAAITLVVALDAADPSRLGRKRDTDAVGFVTTTAVSNATDREATARKLQQRLAQVLARGWNE